MGRPPCSDKEGIKKGPWTPEEDIILVSYIQQHGPSNWRSVPLNTGLLRCSKSCRLRWTNYLRPGIKRGNFTPHEEGIIIHLQALLGNKWAAIASYLPQRTDNDIKNYWNTHLKKKLKKLQSALGPHSINVASSPQSADSSSRSFGTERPSAPGTTTLPAASSSGGGYASSADNISRLLETWMRQSPKTNQKNSRPDQENISCFNLYHPKTEQECANLMSREEFDSMLSFDNLNDVTWDKSSCDSGSKDSGHTDNYDEEKEGDKVLDAPRSLESPPQLSVLEKWLFDESSGQIMKLDPIL